MPVIPVYRNPYPDELMYSWIHRLAKKNGLPITTFADSYLNKFNSKLALWNMTFDMDYYVLTRVFSFKRISKKCSYLCQYFLLRLCFSL